MLSKKDYREYIEQMKVVEVFVRDLYAQGIEVIEDREVKDVFALIMADENRHISLVEELAKIFEV